MNRESLSAYSVPAAVCAAGALLLAGCNSAPREEPRWEAGQVSNAAPTPSETPSPTRIAQTPVEAACQKLVEAGAAIEPEECKALPAIGEGANPIKAPLTSLKTCEGDGGSKLLGRMTEKGVEGNMPAAQIEALASAGQNPVASELIEYADDVLIYSMSTDPMGWSRESALYKEDSVQLCMDPVSNGNFGTTAGVRTVLTHEGAHAAYAELESLARANTPQGEAIKKELAVFKGLGLEEFTYIAEQFRVKYSKDAVEALQVVRTKLDPADTAYIAAVDELTQLFKVQNGLADVFLDDKGFVDHETGTLYSAIDALAVKHGYRGKDKLENKDISMPDWSMMDSKGFPNYVSENLSYMLEGVILSSITSENAGHPTNITEQVASAIATTTVHPKAVNEATRKLPFAQRKIVMEKFASLQRLMNMLNPELAEHLQLGNIAMDLESGIIAEKAAAKRSLTIALRSEINNGVQLMGNDWRNLPASAARAYA